MTERRTLAVFAALGLVLIAGVVAASSALAGGPGKGQAASMQALRGVNFVGNCRFSHRAPDDPIVFPGQPGRSHDHSFVGSVSTNAFSTTESLLASATTCRRAGETAAYWMPTLLQNGQPVEPAGATIYYRRKTLARVTPFPAGFRVVAGSAQATSEQGRRVTFWNCGAMAGVPPSSIVPTCPDTERSSLRLHVSFPDCSDGRLDSSDHMSHMAYSMRGRCPASHPTPMPAIALIFRYPSTGGPGVTLASGSQFTAHADFFNAWHQGTLRSLTNRCLNALRHCGRGR